MMVVLLVNVMRCNFVLAWDVNFYIVGSNETGNWKVAFKKKKNLFCLFGPF